MFDDIQVYTQVVASKVSTFREFEWNHEQMIIFFTTWAFNPLQFLDYDQMIV